MKDLGVENTSASFFLVSDFGSSRPSILRPRYFTCMSSFLVAFCFW